MEATKITLNLPESYVEDAQDFGMLDVDTILSVLRTELDQRIMDFVDVEVKAHRAEQKQTQQPSRK